MGGVANLVLKAYENYQVWRLRMLFPESFRTRVVGEDMRRQREDEGFIIEEYVAAKVEFDYALAVGDRCSPGRRLISLIDGFGASCSRLFDGF